jgi:hypothetical protein
MLWIEFGRLWLGCSGTSLHSDSVKGGEYLDNLNDYFFLKEGPAQ